MEILSVKNLSFTYNGNNRPAFTDACFSVNSGDFVLLCGQSGCGKTTLLRLIKSSLAPSGTISGSIQSALPDEEIGFVFQNPESQIVMDTVMDELVFGCENLGMDTAAIRLRLCELTAFFGIENLLDKKCHTLSGGQKQLINLASVMMMEPRLLLLDEPLSQLDPVASSYFLNLLERLHSELGTTVIICEHNLKNLLDKADRIIYMPYIETAYGSMVFDSQEEFTAHILEEHRLMPDHSFYENLPAGIKAADSGHDTLSPHPNMSFKNSGTSACAIQVKNLYFRYEKNSPDIISGLSFSAEKGEITAITGGIGAGKSTLLSLLTGYKKPYRGKIITNGRVAYLPQNPSYAFLEDELLRDLKLLCKNNHIAEDNIYMMAESRQIFSQIPDWFHMNPLDLSGGQRQLAALYKLLLLKPGILLLDEPTKGLDGMHKALTAELFTQLAAEGVTIIIASHDLQFVSRTAANCAMMFRGDFCAYGPTDKILSANFFYNPDF